MRNLLLGITAVLAMLSLSDAVQAQPRPGISTYSPPAVSPYLNLLRPGTLPAVNYFALVQPQIQTDQDIQGLSAGVNQNRQSLTNMNSLMSSTGHATQFMNLGGYFLNGAGGSTGSAGGGGMMGNVPGATSASFDLGGTQYGAGALNGGQGQFGPGGLNNVGPYRR